MTDLNAIRARWEKAQAVTVETRSTTGLRSVATSDLSAIWDSARDVELLLSLAEQVKPLVQAARWLTLNGEDTGALERLVEECDQFHWSALDILGITEDGED